jgi:membrane-associated protease RseP (regulator of RpoE activity)
MLSAGSFSNILLGFLLMFFTVNLMLPAFTTSTPGIYIAGVTENGPADLGGINTGDIVTEVNGDATETLESMYAVFKTVKPGDSVTFKTTTAVHRFKAGDNPENGGAFFGIFLVECEGVLGPTCYNTKYGIPQNVFWFVYEVLAFTFFLNVGIGIFNLLPLKPFDGGRMVEVVAKKYIPKQSKSIVRGAGIATLLLILVALGHYISTVV